MKLDSMRSTTMSTPGEPHPLSPRRTPPIVSVPFDPRAVEGQPKNLRSTSRATSYTLRQPLADRRHHRFITLVAVLYALVAKPVYEANLMIHVEEESPNASKNILSEASSLFETKKAAIAEMELLRSRMVVSRAVDNLQLYIDVRPKYFPIAGFWFANQNGNALSNPGCSAMAAMSGAPRRPRCRVRGARAWLNREFALTALGNGRYRFSGGGQRIVFDGNVGLRYRVPTPGRRDRAQGGPHVANAGARFRLRRISRVAMIQAIQTALVITEQGKQSGMIEVKLQGENARRTHSVLSEIGREYMRQNLARKTEEAEKSLAFLNQQLPILKRQLEQAEDRYNQFRNEHGTIDLQEEARMSLAQAAAARARRIDLIQKKTELLARFTEDHPIVLAINRQRKEVEAEIEEVNAASRPCRCWNRTRRA
jgi:tyrosine-protein kinase Etk/Wzc